MTGSVGVACKLSHSVVYMKMKRLERGKYEMEFIPMCMNASEFTPDELMKKYYPITQVVCFNGDAHCYKVFYQPEVWIEVVKDFLNNP
mgnify:CR=1 FL=1